MEIDKSIITTISESGGTDILVYLEDGFFGVKE